MEKKAINISVLPGVVKDINVTTSMVAAVLVAAALSISYFIPKDGLASVAGLMRICGGWLLLAVAVILMAFKSTHWVRKDTGSAILRKHVYFRPGELSVLKSSVRDVEGFENLRIGESDTAHVAIFHSKDRQFAAVQVFRDSEQMEHPVSGIGIMSGKRAERFLATMSRPVEYLPALRDRIRHIGYSRRGRMLRLDY